MSTDTKFKFNEQLVVPAMLVNGSRMDVKARFMKYSTRPTTAGMAVVRIDGLDFTFPPERLIRWDDYEPNKGEGDPNGE